MTRSFCIAVVTILAVFVLAACGPTAWAQAAGDPAAAPVAPGAVPGTTPGAAPAAAPAPAPAPATPAPSAEKPDKKSEKKADEGGSGLWGILKAGGLVGLVIVLLSVGAVALVIEHIMTIREPILMPPGMADEVREMVAHGRFAAAQQRCQQDPSFLSFVLEAGIGEADGGYASVEKATEDALADQSARLFRKIEYLSVIGNIAPMLGLLGTVIGMIMAFQKVASTQGAANAADLASGIYQALVTTVEGLIVAIPSLAAFAVFRNRVDQLVAETAYVAQHVFAPMKRQENQAANGGAQQPAGASAASQAAAHLGATPASKQTSRGAQQAPAKAAPRKASNPQQSQSQQAQSQQQAQNPQQQPGSGPAPPTPPAPPPVGGK